MQKAESDDTSKQLSSGDQREAPQGGRSLNLVVVGQESLKGCLSFDSFVLCHLKVCFCRQYVHIKSCKGIELNTHKTWEPETWVCATKGVSR